LPAESVSRKRPRFRATQYIYQAAYNRPGSKAGRVERLKIKREDGMSSAAGGLESLLAQTDIVRKINMQGVEYTGQRTRDQRLSPLLAKVEHMAQKLSE